MYVGDLAIVHIIIYYNLSYCNHYIFLIICKGKKTASHFVFGNTLLKNMKRCMILFNSARLLNFLNIASNILEITYSMQTHRAISSTPGGKR